MLCSIFASCHQGLRYPSPICAFSSVGVPFQVWGMGNLPNFFESTEFKYVDFLCILTAIKESQFLSTFLDSGTLQFFYQFSVKPMCGPGGM